MRAFFPLAAVAVLLFATPCLAKIKTGSCGQPARNCAWAELSPPRGWTKTKLMSWSSTELRLLPPSKLEGLTFISAQIEQDKGELASLDAYVEREIANYTKIRPSTAVAMEPITAADGQVMKVVFLNPTVNDPRWHVMAYGRDATSQGKPYFVIIDLYAATEAVRTTFLPEFRQVVAKYGK